MLYNCGHLIISAKFQLIFFFFLCSESNHLKRIIITSVQFYLKSQLSSCDKMRHNSFYVNRVHIICENLILTIQTNISLIMIFFIQYCSQTKGKLQHLVTKKFLKHIDEYINLNILNTQIKIYRP